MRSSPILACAFCLVIVGASAGATPYNLGRTASPAEIAGWDIDVRPDGAGLPPGRGDVEQGEALFARKCASCHGDRGVGGVADRLAGGRGSLASSRPIKTVGSYWPYPTTLFDYIRRAMPYGAPQSLTSSEVYAAAAYVLWINDIVPRKTIMDRRSLPQVRMPNRSGFVP